MSSSTLNTKIEASSTKMLIAMVGIGIVCALLIVFTYEQTLPIIEKNKKAALEKAIFKVVPGISSTRTFQLTNANELIIADGKDEKAKLVYAGYNKQNELVGVALEGAGQGYADIIKVLYGYNVNTQKIIGFYVLETKETPGLGDKIEKDQHFLDNFKALDAELTEDGTALKNKVITVKNGTKVSAWEIDGITGATISSRAIGDLMGESAQFWLPIIQKNKDKLIMNEVK
jgi:electron transport complex protein RnfG